MEGVHFTIGENVEIFCHVCHAICAAERVPKNQTNERVECGRAVT